MVKDGKILDLNRWYKQLRSDLFRYRKVSKWALDGPLVMQKSVFGKATIKIKTSFRICRKNPISWA